MKIPKVSSAKIPNIRKAAYLLTCALLSPLTLFAADSGSPDSSTSGLGLLGALIAWPICSGRKRRPIGGWLLFFYWQLYGGLLVSAAVFAMNIQSYVPENYENRSQFALLLASTVPSLVLLAVGCAVGTLLLSTRTWDMLRLLRWVLIAGLAAAGLSAVISAFYFPDYIALSFPGIAFYLVWWAYFSRSERIKHIFYLHDWDVAVNDIHPLKPKTAT